MIKNHQTGVIPNVANQKKLIKEAEKLKCWRIKIASNKGKDAATV